MTGASAVQLVIYGATNGAVVALNAVGFTLAYGVARQINLAHGKVFALTTLVVASTASALGVSVSAPTLARRSPLAPGRRWRQLRGSARRGRRAAGVCALPQDAGSARTAYRHGWALVCAAPGCHS